MIADVQMPGMTGLELYDRLVRSGKVIPTILMTAFPSKEDKARALRAGVVGYLTKPFSDSELLACIRAALDYRKTDTRGRMIVASESDAPEFCARGIGERVRCRRRPRDSQGPVGARDR